MMFWLMMILNSNIEEVKADAIITNVQGSVKIFRIKEKKIVDAELGMGLFSGDSIKTGKDGEVTIVYNDGKILSIGKSQNFGILRSDIDTLTRGKGEETIDKSVIPERLFAFSSTGEKIGTLISLRKEDDTTGIEVYEPGNTSLINNKPDFIWSFVKNAEKYIVLIQKMGNVIWEKSIKDTFLKYPEDQNGLEPGSYLYKIIAIKGNDTLSVSERFIKILKPDVQKEVLNGLNIIKSMNPDSFTLHFLSARIYEEKKLNLDAIKEYQILLRMKPNEPEIHKALSFLYNETGLVKFANKHNEILKQLKGEKNE